MPLMLSLFLSTFVLEDVALGSALVFISQGKINFLEAFMACSLGIIVGDIGLYILGRFASKFSYFKRKADSAKFKYFLENLLKHNKMDFAVVISRAVPGTRTPTYFAAGIIRYSFLKFILLTILSVSAWVFITLFFGKAVFLLVEENWILAFFLFFISLTLLKKLFTLLSDHWSLKSAMHSWRKWLHFEFWPSWFFYLPIIPYYLMLSARYRSLLIPFYASPNLKHGGLIGESKWDFLRHLDTKSKSTLPAFLLNKNITPDEILSQLKLNGINFPCILKPDIGQRGFGVRIIKTEQELFDYLKLSEGQIIVQQKSQFLSEAGIFYVKAPFSDRGFIFSITDKKFPFLIGDGKTSLGNLILRNKRSRIIASTYFKRHKDFLDSIIQSNEKYVLSECGNHCQGALFLNGIHLSTSKLLTSIEQITKQIPEFYFGRIDIRYKDELSLKDGTNFEIIEVNGAGSEATHIWDSSTKLLDAYKVLFQQWSLLFSIGAAIKSEGRCQKPELIEFIFDCIRVYFRKGPLTTSS